MAVISILDQGERDSPGENDKKKLEHTSASNKPKNKITKLKLQKIKDASWEETDLFGDIGVMLTTQFRLPDVS